ncbi:MAG: hypothetical protein AAF517_26350, partial [Planctomycetota bacterium]
MKTRSRQRQAFLIASIAVVILTVTVALSWHEIVVYFYVAKLKREPGYLFEIVDSPEGSDPYDAVERYLSSELGQSAYLNHFARAIGEMSKRDVQIAGFGSRSVWGGTWYYGTRAKFDLKGILAHAGWQRLLYVANPTNDGGYRTTFSAVGSELAGTGEPLEISTAGLSGTTATIESSERALSLVRWMPTVAGCDWRVLESQPGTQATVRHVKEWVRAARGPFAKTFRNTYELDDAAHVLFFRRSASAVPDLLAQMGNPSQARVALDTLTDIGFSAAVFAALCAEPPALSLSSIPELADADDQVKTKIAVALAEARQHRVFHQEVLRGLVQYDERARPFLLSSLAHKHESVRVAAAYAISNYSGQLRTAFD